jgi:hypothetical protein
MGSLLIRNAQAVVTVDAEDRVLEQANILIESSNQRRRGDAGENRYRFARGR